MSQRRLLIVDDDRLFVRAIGDGLAGMTAEVVTAHSVREARSLCQATRFDVVLLDNTLPDGTGLDVVRDIHRVNDRAKIILVTAFPSFENAVSALKQGIYDYHPKPIDLAELRLAVERAFTTADLEKVAQVQKYKSSTESDDTILIGSGSAFEGLRELITRAANVRAPVLITGETGTGKSLVARSIHYSGLYRNQALISVNCASIPDTLVESELFGVEKGAYTGATATRKGLFEIADGGTLFLDEIAEMPVSLQSKLLGVLEDRTVRRLGGEISRTVSVRIVSATNVDPDRAIADGKFRLDLYYRLNVVRIHLAPLRERRHDIAELCRFLVRQLAPGRRVDVSEPEIERLMDYEWPGNIRELKNVLDRCLILEDGSAIEPSRLLSGGGGSSRVADEVPDAGAPILPLADVERSHILRAHARLGGNKSKMAEALGISIATLKRKLASYGVTRGVR